jgi:hypothetical protein
MDNSFKENMLVLANEIRKTNSLPESDDINDAAILLLTHIVVFAQGKSHHFPVKDRIRDSEAIIGAVFLCFVGSQIVLYVKKEGIQLPINDVIAKAGKAVFQLMGTGKASEIIRSGIGQYKMIIKAGDTKGNIREYTDTINQAVWAYIMSKDEGLLEALRRLYLNLYNVKDSLN